MVIGSIGILQERFDCPFVPMPMETTLFQSMPLRNSNKNSFRERTQATLPREDAAADLVQSETSNAVEREVDRLNQPTNQFPGTTRARFFLVRAIILADTQPDTRMCCKIVGS
jgi:hypothetical protein